MSVILDALRKLDRERLSRGSRPPNIAVEIVRADFPRPRKRYALYFVAVVIATAAITYVAMGQFGFSLKSSPPAPLDSSVSSRKASSAPPEIGPLQEPSLPTIINPPPTAKQPSHAPLGSGLSASSPPADISPPVSAQSPESVRSSRGKTFGTVPKIERDAEGKTTSVPPGEKKASPNLIPEEDRGAPASTVKLPEQAPARSATTPSSLRISGIIWSEEPSKRIAVINGMTLNEGSVIEGIKVVEIHPTRVRFFHNDQFFEIPLGVTYPYKAVDK
jgi:hypothetical protein